MALVPAVWNGPFPGETPDGKTLQPGAEHQVTEQELESGHWAAKSATKPRAGKSASSKSTEGSTTSTSAETSGSTTGGDS